MSGTGRIPLSEPFLGGKERDYVLQCIEDNWVSSAGPFVERFEREFSARVRASNAVACASGTAALHLALRALGVTRGSLVAVSSFTFIASANAAAYQGADLLLVDSERETWNLDSERLHAEVVERARLGKRLPDAVVAVHVLGHPASMEPLLDLRARFGVAVVEDAAEALGARYVDGPLAGRHVGVVGDIGCFSFNGNKIMTTGGGGMLVAGQDDVARTARHLSTQARLPGEAYWHDDIGYNYRLTNVAAAIGCAQLEQLDSFLQRKRAVARRYDELLVDTPLTLPPRQPWAEPTFWLYTVLAPEAGVRSRLQESLWDAGVEARPVWPHLDRQPPYQDAECLRGEVAEDLAARGLSLPSSVGISDEQVERVAEVLRNELM